MTTSWGGSRPSRTRTRFSHQSTRSPSARGVAGVGVVVHEPLEPPVVPVCSNATLSQSATSAPVVDELSRWYIRAKGPALKRRYPPVLLPRIPLVPLQCDVVEASQRREKRVSPVLLH